MHMATNLTGEEHGLLCKGRRGGEFTVKSAYRELSSTEVQQTGWPWRMIWRTEIPYKVNYFTWLLIKEAVLTHENLNKRNLICVLDAIYVKNRWRQSNFSFYTANGQINRGRCSSARGRSSGQSQGEL